MGNLLKYYKKIYSEASRNKGHIYLDREMDRGGVCSSRGERGRSEICLVFQSFFCICGISLWTLSHWDGLGRGEGLSLFWTGFRVRRISGGEWMGLPFFGGGGMSPRNVAEWSRDVFNVGNYI